MLRSPLAGTKLQAGAGIGEGRAKRATKRPFQRKAKAADPLKTFKFKPRAAPEP